MPTAICVVLIAACLSDNQPDCLIDSLAEWLDQLCDALRTEPIHTEPRLNAAGKWSSCVAVRLSEYVHEYPSSEQLAN